ncbi:MAG: tRNA-dihydrouridine synthase, partial [Clostridia bacterium]|nr:tRNA-dihydrouridine synthase [Clostridia bacterium]
MKIGNIELKHGLFLAPMAGVSDAAFRRMCKKYGAEMVCTEMISSRALCYNDKKTKELAVISDDERPCALQIFGNDPEIMAKSALIALEFSPDAIDINMGCPAPKIAGNGDGSALMRKPKLAYEIVK